MMGQRVRGSVGVVESRHQNASHSENDAMTSQLQVKANQRNALKSTGPRSDAGKDRARWNAMSHGLRATLPIVPGESSSEWQGFREGVLDDLKPVGVLERELAERVALLSWRMRRVTASESVGIIIAGNRAVKQLTGASLSAYESTQTRTVVNVRERLQERVKQHAYVDRVINIAASLERDDNAEAISGDDVMFLLAELCDDPPDGLEPIELEDDGMVEDHFREAGLPDDAAELRESWPGWTVGHVRAVLGTMAPPGVVQTLAKNTRRNAEQTQLEHVEAVKTLNDEWKVLVARAEVQIALEQVAVGVPALDAIERLTRYESHLTKMLHATLDQLARLKASKVTS